MVSKLLKTITQPVRGLHQAAYLLAFLTLASQLLALVRDRQFAHQFGAGEMLDLYYAAFRVPDLVFALVASLVSAYVLIPRLSGGDPIEMRKLISQTSSFLFVVGALICTALAFAAPTLLSLMYPSLMAGQNADEFVLLTRLLLLQPIILGLSGIATSVTQVKRKFLIFALSPVLYNLGIIGGTLFLYPVYGLSGVGMGVVIGALLHLAIHIPVLTKERLLPVPTIPNPAVIWGVMKDSLPRSMALAMGSLVTLALTILAARTGEGGVSVFTFASNLEAVPLSLIGAAYATAAFPVLAEHHRKKQSVAYRDTISAAARHIIFWSVIVMVLTIVLRAHIVRIVLGTGAFGWDDTRLTAAILAILIVALAAQGIILLCARAFYAAQRSWNPLLMQLADAGVSVAVAVGLLTLATNYPQLQYFMETLFRVDGVSGSSILFIAVGATIGQLLVATAALITLRTVAPGIARSLIRPLFEALGAGILGGTAAYGVLSFMGNVEPLTTTLAVFTQGLLAGMVGLLVAIGVLVSLRNKEFQDLSDSLKRLTTRALPPAGSRLEDGAAGS